MLHLILALLACADAPGDSGATAPPTSAPTLASRPAAETCADRVAPAEPACDAAYASDSQCAAHADCTDGEQGTCLRGGSYGLWCICAYDACNVDADCPNASVCGCAADPAYQSPTNRCVAADCLVDADCPSGRCQADHGPWCGSAGADDVLPIRGWHCATEADLCDGDEDCDVEEGDRCIFVDAAFRCSDAYANSCD